MRSGFGRMWGLGRPPRPGSGSGPPPERPTNTAAPALTGTGVTGAQHSLSAGSWSETPEATDYRWLDGQGIIAGANASTFTPGAGFDGATIQGQVRVRGANGLWSLWATSNSKSIARANSAPTGTSGNVEFLVASDFVAAPLTVTADPTISGTGVTGSTLTVGNSTWSGAYAEMQTEWLDDGVLIAGATGSTFVPGAGLDGSTVTVRQRVRAAGAPFSDWAVSDGIAIARANSAPTGTAGDVEFLVVEGAGEFPTELAAAYNTAITPIDFSTQISGPYSLASGYDAIIAGLSLNASTGVLSGTPSERQGRGWHSIRVQGSNGYRALRMCSAPDMNPANFANVYNGTVVNSATTLQNLTGDVLILNADINATLTLRNLGGSGAIVVIANPDVDVASGDGIRLSNAATVANCTIWNGNFVTAQNGIIAAYASAINHLGMRVLNNTIVSSGSSGGGSQLHGMYLEARDVLVEGNTVSDSAHGSGISMRSSGVVRGNTVDGALNDGVTYYPSGDANGGTLLVEQNTFLDVGTGPNNRGAISLIAPGDVTADKWISAATLRNNTLNAFPVRVDQAIWDDDMTVGGSDAPSEPPPALTPPGAPIFGTLTPTNGAPAPGTPSHTFADGDMMAIIRVDNASNGAAAAITDWTRVVDRVRFGSTSSSVALYVDVRAWATGVTFPAQEDTGAGQYVVFAALPQCGGVTLLGSSTGNSATMSGTGGAIGDAARLMEVIGTGNPATTTQFVSAVNADLTDLGADLEFEASYTPGIGVYVISGTGSGTVGATAVTLASSDIYSIATLVLAPLE